MQISRYKELKTKSLINLNRVGQGFSYTCKRFDPETGMETMPEIGALNIDELTAQKARMQAEMEGIDVLIADCQALP